MKVVLKKVASHRLVMVGVQLLVSITILALLIQQAQQRNLAEVLLGIPPDMLLLAALLQLGAHLLSTQRWYFLLRHTAIKVGYWRLVVLYFIGLFCSLFLPTSVGGDAVRAYEVGRRSNRYPEAILVTLQERMVGLSGQLLIGLVATAYYINIVPASLRIWVLVLLGGGFLLTAMLIYPQLLFRAGRRMWEWCNTIGLIRRATEHPLAKRLSTALSPLEQMRPFRPITVLSLLGVTILAGLFAIGTYYAVAYAIGISMSFTAFCLVVPLVTVIRLAPVSFGGIGVGEASFVFLMGLFLVPNDQSLAMAISVLALQIVLAMLGGLPLLVRVLRSFQQVSTPMPVEQVKSSHD